MFNLPRSGKVWYRRPNSRRHSLSNPQGTNSQRSEGVDSSSVEPPQYGRVREHHLPLECEDLVRLLSDSLGLTTTERHEVEQLSWLLQTVFHHEFHSRLLELRRRYALFNPDRETASFATEGVAPPQNSYELFSAFQELLERANFKRLTPQEIAAATKIASHWGLNLEVDFEVYEHLEVYVRGLTIGRRSYRSWKTKYQLRELEVPIYQRLVVIFRLRKESQVSDRVDTEGVYIKLFKDIPQADVEMLLPGSDVRMTNFDRTKIALPTLSGLLLTSWKLVSGALIFAWQGFYGMLVTLGMVGGTLGYGVRSFFGYLNTRQKYQLSLTESLYYQNLDNNAGVIFHLLNEAEEQEHREALVALLLLSKAGNDEGLQLEELDARAEALLNAHLPEPVDFEANDAVHKLLRLRLCETLPDGRLRAIALPASIAMLQSHLHRLVYDFPESAR